jgi:hypothetical protein
MMWYRSDDHIKEEVVSGHPRFIDSQGIWRLTALMLIAIQLPTVAVWLVPATAKALDPTIAGTLAREIMVAVSRMAPALTAKLLQEQGAAP